ncbi:MAG: aspartate aminotransferase family protein, partial [Actinomycetota bacterium]|nr:aspartate aminotransferase family protein [Actinomycetota bacterium]
PIVSEVRGAGYFYAIELQKDARRGIAFEQDETADIVARLKPVLLDLGLIARADGRGAAIIQYSPPLIAGPDEFREIVRITRESIERVSRDMCA